MTSKICANCKIDKPESDYYLNKEGKISSGWCKKCIKEANKARYHDSGGIDAIRLWRQNNKELYKAQLDRSNAKRNIRKQQEPSYKKHLADQKREISRRHYIYNMFSRAKKRATNLSIEFTLSMEDIIVPDKCPILNVPIVLGVKGSYRFTPTLDRIIGSKGYTKENTRVISMLANTMKSSASREELEQFSKNILAYMDNVI